MDYLGGTGQAEVYDFLKKEGVETKALAGEGVTIYTYSFPCLKGASYSFEYQFSGTTVRAKVELEQGNQAPATEGAADTAFVVPQGAAELHDAVTATTNNIKAYAPAATAFLRLKISANSTNGANTVLTKAKMTVIRS